MNFKQKSATILLSASMMVGAGLVAAPAAQAATYTASGDFSSVSYCQAWAATASAQLRMRGYTVLAGGCYNVDVGKWHGYVQYRK